MSSLNKVQIIGNVGKDPEFRSFQSGDRVATFSVATTEKWKDKSSGEQKEKTEWHRVNVHNQGLLRVIEQYVRKGSKVYIEGQLETRKWTDGNGLEKYSTEIVLGKFKGELLLLGDKQAYEAPESKEQKSTYQAKPSIPDDFEDEIPF